MHIEIDAKEKSLPEKVFGATIEEPRKISNYEHDDRYFQFHVVIKRKKSGGSIVII